jgi:hypothetical protein
VNNCKPNLLGVRLKCYLVCGSGFITIQVPGSRKIFIYRSPARHLLTSSDLYVPALGGISAEIRPSQAFYLTRKFASNRHAMKIAYFALSMSP